MNAREVFRWRPEWREPLFWARVNKDGPVSEYAPPLGPCWVWTGAFHAKTGYGKVIIDGHVTGAHQVAYRLAVGPIPPGLDIDHLCRVHRCVNPSHLEPVTRRENLLRGDTVPARRARVTHCPKGHPYDEVNTYLSKRNQRECRTCRRENNRRRRTEWGKAKIELPARQI